MCQCESRRVSEGVSAASGYAGAREGRLSLMVAAAALGHAVAVAVADPGSCSVRGASRRPSGARVSARQAVAEMVVAVVVEGEGEVEE